MSQKTLLQACRMNVSTILAVAKDVRQILIEYRGGGDSQQECTVTPEVEGEFTRAVVDYDRALHYRAGTFQELCEATQAQLIEIGGMSGYENNEGGYGEITFEDGHVKHAHSDYVIETNDTESTYDLNDIAHWGEADADVGSEITETTTDDWADSALAA